MVLLVLLVIFRVDLFLINFNFIMLVMCSFMSNALTIAIPDNSSTNGASITTIFCTSGKFSVFLGKKGRDQFRKLRQESCESITPSSKSFDAQNQIYIFMNFRDQSENVQPMPMYVYNFWNHKEYTNTLSIPYLNSLSI